MMEAREMDRSRGEKSASDVDELDGTPDECARGTRAENVPHAHEILHHEFVQRLGRVGHVDLALSILEVGLAETR